MCLVSYLCLLLTNCMAWSLGGKPRNILNPAKIDFDGGHGAFEGEYGYEEDIDGNDNA